METIKDYVIIILAITLMVFIMVRGCTKPFHHLEVTPIKQVIYKSDTIFSKDTLIKLKTIYRPKYDTIYKIDTVNDTVKMYALDTLSYIRVYKDSISDTNQVIYSNIRTIGILDKYSLSYKLKPKPIVINSIKQIDTVYKPSKLSIYAGLELGGNASSFNLSPFVSICYNQSLIGYRYGVLNGTHSIAVGYKIFNSKK